MRAKLLLIVTLFFVTNSTSAMEMPGYVESFLKAQEIHTSRKGRKELLPYARKAIEGLKDNPDAWAILADSEFLNGNWPQAITAYEKAIELGPRMYRWRYYAQVGRSYAQIGKKDEAFAWLNKALVDRYQERDDFAGDEYLKPLQDDPRFRELAGLPPENITDRKAKWRYDLDFYRKEIFRLHPNPYWRVSKKEFDAAFSKLLAAVETKSDEEMIVELQKFSGLYGDGHTNGKWYETFEIYKDNLLPFRFAFFPEGLFIVDAAPGYEKYYGAKVEAIDDFPGSEVLPKVVAWTGRDNDVGWPKEIGTYSLRVGYYLQAIVGSKSPREFRFMLRTGAAKPVDVMVKTGSYEFFKKPVYYASLYPSRLMKKVPLYLEKALDYFWLKDFGTTLYVQMNVAHDKENETHQQFAARIQKLLRDKKTLIVDVRLHPGGDGYLIKYITSVIIGFANAAPANKVFIVTGRRTFSAANGFITNIDKFTDAIFVGEPPGSAPNAYAEATTVVLPFAKVAFGISCFYSQDSTPEDKRRYIAPEWPIELTAAEYFSGRDPVLEKLLDREGVAK